MDNNFVAYEYKSITVKRDSVAIYIDCLSNFGWTLVDEHEYRTQPAIPNVPHVHTHVQAPDDLETVALKFKRDRRIKNKTEVNSLERTCVDALSAIGGLERKDSAHTIGISLGTGIVGTAIIGIAVYSFMSANVAVGVLLAVLGFAGWGVGFFANRKLGKKRSIQSEPMIQAQLDVAYSACEQAHALLAS